MFGGVLKTYWAEKNNIDPKKIVSVSIMPCTAKKFEINRSDMEAAGEGIADVDISLTTRELARLIKLAGIDFRSLPDEKFDDPLGNYTGAGVIFGVTGGVMEAALRTAVWRLTGENDSSPIEFKEIRGFDGIKEATYDVAGLKVNICVVSGTANAKKAMELVKSCEKQYHFIEIMACPGGCINGGGQPHVDGTTRNFVDYRALRAKVLYDSDTASTLRRSHENPDIKELYANYLEKPGSHKSHHILHTSFVEREVNKL
jgi:NADP-reducing hydrogenase subunit HndD